MRRVLKLLGSNTLLNYRRDAVEDMKSLATVLKRNAHLLVPGVEDGIEDVPLHLPTQTNSELLRPTKVDGMLLPNGPIELTLERMKKKIDLVKEKDAASE